jgi:GNAT superfamily N-acetyltransferase
MTSPNVRRAAPDEAGELAAILHEAFAEYQSLYTDQAFANTTPGEEQVRRRMDEGPLWVSLLEDRIVGTLAAVQKGDGLYLRGMGVLPEARGTGQGRLLLEVAETFARQNGFRRLYLSTTPFLDRAIQLYESFGFTRTSEGPHDLFETPLFTMEKLLTEGVSREDTKNTKEERSR